MAQQRGSITKLYIARETTYNEVVAGASRKVVALPFISEGFSATRPQNLSNVIRKRRDGPSQPFLGFRDVKGQLQLAVDLRNTGWVLAMMFGLPTTVQSYTGADIKDGPTSVTVSGGSGGYTLNNPQSASAPLQVGDRMVFSTGASAWITTYTDNDQGVIQNERAGGSAIANGTYTITAIIRNQSSAGTPTITITNGVGVPSVAQPNARQGDLIIYANTAGTFSSAWIGTVNSTTSFNLVDGEGFPLRGGTVAQGGRDVTASAIESIERPGLYTHTFKAGQTAVLPSWTTEKQFNDISPAYIDRYTGVKANQFGVNIGGDQELAMTVDGVGAGFSSPTGGNGLDSGRYASIPAFVGTGNGTISTPVLSDGASVETFTLTCTTPGGTGVGIFSVVGSVSGTLASATVGTAYSGTYVLSGVTHTVSFTLTDGSTDFDTADVFTFAVRAIPVAEVYEPQFEQFDATVSEGGSTSAGDPIQSANLTVMNNLDESGYTINGHETRTQLPEGIMGASWAITALFEDSAIVDKETEDTESSISVTFAKDDGQGLTLTSDRIKYSQADPQVGSPAGVTISAEAMAYVNINDANPCVYATLTNTQQSYT